MNKIIITGASGDLAGRITAILQEKVGADRLILSTRTPENLKDAEESGASVRYGDYDDPASLEVAFSGGSIILIISGLAINRRVQQHRNAINAAIKAGLGHIVYTSTAGLHPSNPTLSAREHIVTEQDLRDCGLPYTILRNATYAEVIATLMLAPALVTGKWEHAAGKGYLAPVSKRDVAACAACCLLEPERHKNAVYEITGPELLTFRDMAAIASEVYDRPIEFVPITVEEAYARFDAMGIPRSYEEGMKFEETHAWPSDEMVSASLAMAQGYHALMSRHVDFITGRPAIPLRTIMMEAKGKTYDQI